MTSAEILDWQRNLTLVGYDVPQSGVFDDDTARTTAQFKYEIGLPADSEVDEETLSKMYDYIDTLNNDSAKPYIGRQDTSSPLAIVGQAPSWLWWLGASLGAGLLIFAVATSKPGRARRRAHA